ncbi:MAG: cyclopropane-fatty-acyl-phospholipid synthase family protein [Micropepsaceae bacterium]
MKTLLIGMLRKIITSGRLTIVGSDGAVTDIGDMTCSPITLKLHDKWVAFDLLRDPNLAFGEAYMNGRMTIENGDIGDLLGLLGRNMGTGIGGGHLWWLAQLRTVARHWQRLNTGLRSQKNVAHHYDLSGRLYDLFLDHDKQYSCAFFETENDTLEQAQLNKKHRIAAKLALQPGHRVLDIGSGWGGFGIFLASIAPVDVVGITLSAEQLKVANGRAASLDMEKRVSFQLLDYRQIKGTFDRVVSVGMLEHVGVGQYDEYFRSIARLMDEDGVALIHSIGRSDGPGVTNPWIAKYIFPGGYVPALSEVLPAVERSGLIVTDIEILRLHYARTLAEWRRRFVANWHRARRLYDERFCRMWEFYLAGAEMAFRYQGQMVFQMQLTKRVDALPVARDYMMPVQVAPVVQDRDSVYGARS